MVSIQDFDNILQTFNIKAKCVNYQQANHYFCYDLMLEPRSKVKDVAKWGEELSLSLKACNKPNVKILHSQGLVRLEFASPQTQVLNLFDCFTNQNISVGGIPCLLGQGIDGQNVWMELTQNPHMIVAGTTGSGKSTLLHTIIANLLNYSDALLYLADPKGIEFFEYDRKIDNLAIGYSYEEVVGMLDALLNIMEERYSKIRQGTKPSQFKHIVLIIDEFADLIMQDKDDLFYHRLCRLAQKCRAAKINIILSTQRPSTNFIKGAIKANFPARIACRVATHVDSKVILDATGAENLLGNGDALIRDNFRFLERFQVAYTTPTEVCKYFGRPI